MDTIYCVLLLTFNYADFYLFILTNGISHTTCDHIEIVAVVEHIQSLRKFVFKLIFEHRLKPTEKIWLRCHLNSWINIVQIKSMVTQR